MMSGMQDPSYREAIEGKLQNLKNDPELEKIMKEIETGGPAAMMKCAFMTKHHCQPLLIRSRGTGTGDRRQSMMTFAPFWRRCVR